VQVCVPHDQRGDSNVCVDQGPSSTRHAERRRDWRPVFRFGCDLSAGFGPMGGRLNRSMLTSDGNRVPSIGSQRDKKGGNFS
jgi:hypothetical protein